MSNTLGQAYDNVICSLHMTISSGVPGQYCSFQSWSWNVIYERLEILSFLHALLQVFPIQFVEVNYISLDKHVTMEDSTGHRLWHMRMQECSNGPLRVISNGWREFCYDHSLKEKDALVFTLLSFSHFLVEFCSSESTSTTRSMYPTREVDKYPWRSNQYRMKCLSWRSSSENSHYKVSGP